MYSNINETKIVSKEVIKIKYNYLLKVYRPSLFSDLALLDLELGIELPNENEINVLAKVLKADKLKVYDNSNGKLIMEWN